MKKVTFYEGDSLEFHRTVLKAKRNSNADTTYKERMVGREEMTRDQFLEYDSRFREDTLEGMTRLELTDKEKEDYLRLYRYGDVCFQNLEETLSHDENGHEYPYCPLCDIGEYHSLDHILPKGEFPVLCDHPRNLIRCCTTCNGYKSEIWLEDGKRKYLNLYVDEVPSVQILFVQLGIVRDVATYRYYVSDVNNPDPDMFRMYKSSFVKFELAKRYKRQTNEEITNLIEDVKDKIKDFDATDEQLKKSIRGSAVQLQQRHGVNYWRAILKLAFIDNAAMFAWMKSKAV